ncbi:hypothetical protein [Clostridium sp. OS1-26]|uniref:hypothetical protein n=1 Tax=Clostridium sp. OS1-26 TaxID=3070681 RepID=UPI0027DED699|nr:hypothetical protein [Clostridium sp. OS1-26]WML35832.1 hypothetical protein RCG18_03530 [Clostridium sp. OS1-26]
MMNFSLKSLTFHFNLALRKPLGHRDEVGRVDSTDNYVVSTTTYREETLLYLYLNMIDMYK